METTITLFENRTLQKAFLQDGIKAVLKSRKSPLRLENEKDVRTFMSDIMDYVIKHDSHNLYTTYHSISQAFEKYGVHSGDELMVAMYEMREELKKQGYDMSKIKDPKEIIRKYNIQGHTSYVGMDTTRTLVVRSKYGNYPIRFYDYVGAVMDSPQLRAIQLDYHYSTGCPFFERRAILLSTWLTLPEERKYATCTPDGTDFEENETFA